MQRISYTKECNQIWLKYACFFFSRRCLGGISLIKQSLVWVIIIHFLKGIWLSGPTVTRTRQYIVFIAGRWVPWPRSPTLRKKYRCVEKRNKIMWPNESWKRYHFLDPKGEMIFYFGWFALFWNMFEHRDR